MTRPVVLAILLCLPACAGIPRDKTLHAAAGSVAYVAGYEVARALDSEHPSLWALAGVVALGVAKEAYDKRHPQTHTADPMDALAMVAGGFTVSWVWGW